ncbi:aminotransferase class I/II-fold pyridoxal phosphate-dependent enzyme [Streptomyces sp. 3MP-14]|uniref:Aminotransferase class I/II-fold pyridoxal phosphate-dependent enzyme n=1 Tax=Streptomyces mimosae TaxID=2586635 RepID=A0A5N6A4K4_9ACTN|nr:MULTISPECIES: aminotransferase class I/II-fold pyridoxal phosphate-dependent enzyme [Streptomyces]KAB8163717.1 aminotransferase class I/II-fold pyridoxal phosphate-dependent enzyme [Streptomyces mimosae]KAB8175160.1 aminotransferase class I/II-fold pyridoxal phosphate-dependent enzyme [Streptomyces sp. 3MP-14]
MRRSGETSIFTEMTELAHRTGAVNLGQGVPDLDSPPALLAGVAEAVLAGRNQYPPAAGHPALRAAVAEHQRRHYGIELDPASQVLVTTGATEALVSAVLALTGPGDEILTFDPCYDAYPADARLSGATLVPVPLAVERDKDDENGNGAGGGAGFAVDVAALARAITPRSRLLLLNSPHNPTGKVFTPEELARIAELCVAHDLTVVTDEVYEHLVYGEARHVPIATLPGMAERTLTVSSAGKTFSVTGWKVGWISGPAELVAAVASVKQWLTYASGTPYQEAIAAALGTVDEWAAELRGVLAEGRDLLAAGLTEAGLTPFRADAGYFLQADVRPWGFTDGLALCRQLPQLAGVVAIPTRVFQQGEDVMPWLVRFSFCRRHEALREAATRLARLGQGR